MTHAPATAIKVPKSDRILKAISRLNVLLYRLSGGRIMGNMGGPVCLVTMTGRRSGRRITIPLIYNPHGEQVLLVASKGGSDRHPLWYYNITANPQIVIQIGRRKRAMHAHQASAEEKAALWPGIIAHFPSYDSYQKGTARDIPVLVCSPAIA